MRSVRLMEKLGMRLEGIQRGQTRDLHGQWTDLYLYGLLESDWRVSHDTTEGEKNDSFDPVL